MSDTAETWTPPPPKMKNPAKVEAGKKSAAAREEIKRKKEQFESELKDQTEQNHKLIEEMDEMRRRQATPTNHNGKIFIAAALVGLTGVAVGYYYYYFRPVVSSTTEVPMVLPTQVPVVVPSATTPQPTLRRKMVEDDWGVSQ